jgi:hypothetical protein
VSDLSERVRVHSVEVLSDDWYVLKKTTFDFERSDGTWQRQSRETYLRSAIRAQVPLCGTVFVWELFRQE